MSLETVEYDLFQGEVDRFRGVSVSSIKEPKTEEEFPKSLTNSIERWKENKMRAVWMNVYLQHSFWIPTLVSKGFVYHHAKSNCVSMVKWLPEDESNQIPCFAHNTLGVGAFVVNEVDELLVVKERFHTFPQWKLPGGYVEVEEDLSAAAIREVKEETGIDAEFEFVLAFRHIHKANFGCSDMYFIVVLRPKSNNITMCRRELVNCQWMKLTEYLEHEEVHETNKLFARCYLEAKERGVCIKAVQNKLQFHKFSRDQIVYHVSTDEERSLSKRTLINNTPDKDADQSSKI